MFCTKLQTHIRQDNCEYFLCLTLLSCYYSRRVSILTFSVCRYFDLKRQLNPMRCTMTGMSCRCSPNLSPSRLNQSLRCNIIVVINYYWIISRSIKHDDTSWGLLRYIEVISFFFFLVDRLEPIWFRTSYISCKSWKLEMIYFSNFNFIVNDFRYDFNL